MRRFGWNDILSNCMGAVSEFLPFEIVGELLPLETHDHWKRQWDRLLSLWGNCLFYLLVYLGVYLLHLDPPPAETYLA